MNARRLLALLLGAAAGCFTGDGLQGQPCETDADCNGRLDLLGRRIACHDGFCGALCGDGDLSAATEECDDGNADDSDDCVACKKAICGDGAVWLGHEQCDDGNHAPGDGCVLCNNAACGDGFVWQGREACDDGNDDPHDGCAGCENVVCGDGVVNPLAEACDDADADDDDGCNARCELGAEALSTGSSARHGCAVRAGALRCWGANAAGQLGYGHTASVGDEAGDLPLADVAVGGPVAKVVAGYDHTCALLDGGGDNLRCWGIGPGGAAIGDAPGEPPVTVALGGAALDVAAGPGTTCAVLIGGAVRCWAPGDAAPAQQEPIALAGPAVAVSSAGSHSCALLADARVQCWGYNSEGQLGDPAAEGETIAAPVQLGAGARAIAAGLEHTCALLDGGAVRCWGRGVEGQLGGASVEAVGDDEEPASLAAVDLGGTALQIVAGAYHSCAVRDDGAALCWGEGAAGRLGYGGVARVGDDEAPAQLGAVDLPAPVRSLTAGDHHTCALLAGGGVYCWGGNDSGQLAIGGTADIGDEPGEMPPRPSPLYPAP